MIREIPNGNKIKAYFHCKHCFDQKPASISPREWLRIEVGWTKLGLQIWCMRCECNIVHIDFEGAQHPANLTRSRFPEEADA